MAFSFIKRENLAELANQFDLRSYTPSIDLQGLVAGVDNVRYDVWISPSFLETARQHLSRVVAKAGQIEDILARPDDTTVRLGQLKPSRPAPLDASEFKRRLSDLLVASLNRAKAAYASLGPDADRAAIMSRACGTFFAACSDSRSSPAVSLDTSASDAAYVSQTERRIASNWDR